MITPPSNRLLTGLPELERLAPQLEPVELTQGQVLYRGLDKQLQHVYFPASAVVSLCCNLKNGSVLEVANVGSEGVVDNAFFTGGVSTIGSAVVLIAGHGHRLPTQVLLREFYRNGPLTRRLLRCTLTLINQMTLVTACNSRHTMTQRLCRYLLQMYDRIRTRELLTTHEELALRLGTSRTYVSQVIAELRRAGIIKYERRKITVIHPGRLELLACECYSAIKRELALRF